jgi:hypothetical protein
MAMLLQEQKRREKATKTEVDKELQVFRQQVQERRALETQGPLLEPFSKANTKETVVKKEAKKKDFQKQVLMNAVKRRTKSGEDEAQPEKKAKVQTEEKDVHPVSKASNPENETKEGLASLIGYSDNSDSDSS